MKTPVTFRCLADGNTINIDTVDAGDTCRQITNFAVDTLGPMVKETKEETTVEVTNGRGGADVYLSNQEG